MKAVALSALAFSALLVGCRDTPKEVQVDYRPEVGAVFRYELVVSSVTVTTLTDEQPERSVDEATLETTDTVLESGSDGVRVRVDLRRSGSPDRSFVVRFDRAAQLSGVEAVEGLPPDVLGPLAFPELLPAAVTAPPRKPLSPGEEWVIGADTKLPDGSTVRVEGTGRLEDVSTVDGLEVASIRAQTRLPLTSTTKVRGVTVSLEGVETTDSTAVRAVADGSVRSASALTKGDYRITLNGPAGDTSAPLSGTMTVEVRSKIRLLEDPAPGEEAK